MAVLEDGEPQILRDPVVHIGCFQDSVLCWLGNQKDGPQYDLRYFPQSGNRLEFYCRYTGGLPVYLENSGQSRLTAVMAKKGGEYTLDPGQRVRIGQRWEQNRVIQVSCWYLERQSPVLYGVVKGHPGLMDGSELENARVTDVRMEGETILLTSGEDTYAVRPAEMLEDRRTCTLAVLEGLGVDVDAVKAVIRTQQEAQRAEIADELKPWQMRCEFWGNRCIRAFYKSGGGEVCQANIERGVEAAQDMLCISSGAAELRFLEEIFHRLVFVSCSPEIREIQIKNSGTAFLRLRVGETEVYCMPGVCTPVEGPARIS